MGLGINFGPRAKTLLHCLVAGVMRRRTSLPRWSDSQNAQSNPIKSEVTKDICGSKLACGHTCKMKTSHRTKCDCKARCEYKSPCGHQCLNRCSSAHNHPNKCHRRCLLTCLCGRQCTRTCQVPCKPCTARCPIGCYEQRCNAQCHDWMNCQMPKGCTRPCRKVCLGCGKPCLGLCGHPCPPCTACKPFKCPISLETFGKRSTIASSVYMLSDCGCCFEIDSIDAYVKGAIQKALSHGEHRIHCPNCTATITKSWRYADQIRQCLYQTIPQQDTGPFKRTKTTKKELRVVYSAMTSSHYSTNDHWYLCSNGHPYYVGDCGAAVQGARCYECRAPIGKFDGGTVKPWILG